MSLIKIEHRYQHGSSVKDNELRITRTLHRPNKFHVWREKNVRNTATVYFCSRVHCVLCAPYNRIVFYFDLVRCFSSISVTLFTIYADAMIQTAISMCLFSTRLRLSIMDLLPSIRSLELDFSRATST